MKQKLIFPGKILIALGLIAFLYRNNSASFEAALGMFSLKFAPFFILSGVFFMLNILLLALRQNLLLTPIEISSSFKDMFRFAYGGMFANMFLPAGTGYDVIRILHFKSKSSLSCVMGWILTDKIIGLIGLLILSLAAVNIVLLLGGSKEVYILILDCCAFVSIVIVMFLIVSKGATAIIMRSLRKFPWILSNQKVSGFLEDLKKYSANRSNIVYAILLSIASSLMGILGVSVLGYALGGFRMALAALLIAPVVMLSSAIPVSPGNLGWTEVVATGVSYAFGSAGGLTVFILWRIVNIVFSLGGLPQVLNIQKGKKVS